ncbi:MAG: fasciclin domain-containing protein [Pirellulales bacterium]|nr:fasciclin domain-containing protein [Pirellulales bacterium]
MSIVETAVGSGQTNTLVKLLQAADLVEAVSGPGPLTILAPTDDAFAKLPSALVKKLLDPANQAMLQDVLKYHVVVGKALAADVVKLKEIPTLAGPPIKVSMRDGNVYLNDSKVIATDIECSNGVIHLIDAVLLPPKDKKKVVSNSPQDRCRQAMDLITLAIDRGVPVYNHGQRRACAAIYEVACQGLMMDLQSACAACAGKCSVSDEAMMTARRAIEEGMEKIENEDSSKAKAWILRESMDDAYKALNGVSGSMDKKMPLTQK